MASEKDFFESPTLCPAPWTQVAVDTNDELRPCCFVEPFFKKMSNLKEYWNCQTLQEIRSSMLNEKWHPACYKCQIVEENGGVSKRLYESFLIERTFNKEDYRFDLEPISNNEPRVLEIRFGNLCNLKCRMCSPDSSNKIASEYEILNKDIDPDLFPIISSPRLQMSTDTLKKYLPSLDAIRIIRILGGEPFLDKECKKFCQLLVDQQVSENITIILTTNMTYLNEDWIRLLKKFKNVVLQFSLDGTDEVIEYIRDGTSWEEVNQNIHSFLKALPEGRFCFIPCVQAYSVFALKKVYDFYFELKLSYPGHDIVIFPNHLKEPVFLSTNVLPQNMRVLAGQQLSDLLKETVLLNEERTHLASIISTILNQEEASEKTVTQWRNFTLALDQHRNQSIRKSIPELAPLFE